MSAHVRDYPEHILRDLRALHERMNAADVAWGSAPGHERMSDATVFVAEACDEMAAALTARDDYPEYERQLDLLHAAQDARRVAQAIVAETRDT